MKKAIILLLMLIIFSLTFLANCSKSEPAAARPEAAQPEENGSRRTYAGWRGDYGYRSYSANR